MVLFCLIWVLLCSAEEKDKKRKIKGLLKVDQFLCLIHLSPGSELVSTGQIQATSPVFAVEHWALWKQMLTPTEHKR